MSANQTSPAVASELFYLEHRGPAICPRLRRPDARLGAAGARTDEELMRCVQADDTEAFAVVYDRLRERAMGSRRSIVCVDRDHARDVVQGASRRSGGGVAAIEPSGTR